MNAESIVLCPRCSGKMKVIDYIPGIDPIELRKCSGCKYERFNFIGKVKIGSSMSSGRLHSTPQRGKYACLHCKWTTDCETCPCCDKPTKAKYKSSAPS